MENKKLVVGNMKMNLTLYEVENYVTEMKDYKDCVICPSSVFCSIFEQNGYIVGLQNISEYDNGAYTGEVSTAQANSLNIKYVIIGHSERREYFKESDEAINKKVKKALKDNLKVILCVGETLTEREEDRTKDKIKRQLLEDLKNIDVNSQNLIIAYEPIWAIGTGKIPSNDQIIDVVSFIKTTLKQELNIDSKVLYGGSTNENNIDDLNTIDIIDGFLVGGACLSPAKFKKIIETTR